MTHLPNTDQCTAVLTVTSPVTQLAEAAVNSALNAITAALKDGDKVTLVGFGTFEVRERPERKGRNPQTGAEITIEASKLPAFKAGKALKLSLIHI